MLKRIMVLLGCILLLFVSWTAVLGMDTTTALERQTALISTADIEIERGTYINAVPILMQALEYDTEYTFSVMERLKSIHLYFGHMREYENILRMQIARADCPPGIFDELARHQMQRGRLVDALETLRLGVERTGDDALKYFYEQERYAFTLGRNVFDDVTAFFSSGIQVKNDGLWGLADWRGRIIIPPMYAQISTVDNSVGRVVAMKPDGSVVTVNMGNYLTAIFELDMDIVQIGNLSNGVIPLKLSNGSFILANSQLLSDGDEFYGVSTVSNSAIAMQTSDGWGVMMLSGEIVVPFEYDEIIMDEVGQFFQFGNVFARRGDRVYLYRDGIPIQEVFEDARPFADGGWAAVKRGGAWGFINVIGEVEIGFRFEDALSFGQHLAPVRVGEYWGYISVYGAIAIEPVFFEARRFSHGSAPVLTEYGWQIITLIEQ